MKIYNISKLNEWNQCQLKYFGHHIEKEFWEKDKSINLQILLGQLIHEFFEKFYSKSEKTLQFKKELITLSLWKDSFVKAWENILTENPIALEKDTDQNTNQTHLDKGLLCLENFYKRERERDFKIPLYLEQLFVIELDRTFKISGRIDRIDKELDGSIKIIDYKITNSPKTINQAQYDYQLAIYAFACSQNILHQNPTQVGWYYPVQGLDVFTDPRGDIQNEVINSLLEMDNALIKRRDYKEQYTTSPLTGFCDSCGYKQKCPEHT